MKKATGEFLAGRSQIKKYMSKINNENIEKSISFERELVILGIETSCDETAASVVRGGRTVLSNVIYSQIDLHTLYGGVVPEIASRKHIEKINYVNTFINNVIKNANLPIAQNKITSVKIIDILGKVHYNSFIKNKFDKIDISKFKKGLYFVLIGDNNYTLKLLIQ